ncbi:uncharacterized protein LOC127857763 [Dreissena polymorpha]|uniref:Uncharacterized protein n=1 Tax=Dreissena polymorpha TaxID=45954 RepID=A0A9D3YZC9_DREPO|nr:uncharacterized protein LOC127857763 [Dreissena polymorpha]XP_052250380.1 uncharacterized protein LOC127857763 [Dreissena polymorpha]XP_052250381.1 uncharacterized protein LOC127857763 [Dreissena polymorpha]XP_052250382.1 uncharacterized protein LOC127857763 [Dreissena polymorpha]KAH3709072.1 hypothetical protein DPMN_068532 [Dreissena polymorpha]
MLKSEPKESKTSSMEAGGTSVKKVILPSKVSLSFAAQTTNKPPYTTAIYVGSKKISETSKVEDSKNASASKGLKDNDRKLNSKSSTEVPGTNPSNRIELVGFKMTNGSPESSLATEDSKKQKSWTASKLPPCRVCGEDTSPRGLHYGVNTCEACKAFFRRVLKRSNLNFQCTCTLEERRLGTDIPRKTTCPKCRYEQCVKVGMSKDAIKIGRYTIGRKRQNDREVQSLEQGKERVNSGSSISSGSPHSQGQSVSSPEEVSTDIENISLTDRPKSPNVRAVKRLKKDDKYHPETGLLYQSLTNIILNSLTQNQSYADGSANSAAARGDDSNKMTAVEKLFMQPFEMPSSNQSSNSAMQFDFTSQGSNSNPFNSYTKDMAPNLIQSSSNVAFSDQPKQSPIENLLMSPPSVQLPSQTDFFSGIKLSPPNSNQPELPDEKSSIESLLLSPSSGILAHEVSIKKERRFSEQTVPTDSPEYNTTEPSFDETSFHGIHPCDAMRTKNPGLHDGYEMADKIPSYLLENNMLGSPSMDLLNENEAGELDLFNDDELLIAELSQEDIEIELKEYDRYQEICNCCTMTAEMKESIIKNMTDVAMTLMTKMEMVSCNEIKRRHAEYLEKYNLKLQMFGEMKLSKEEYMSFYKQTGIDIDNRQQLVIECLKHLEDSIHKIVTFAKSIPCFTNIDIEDQVKLLKATRFEHDMMKYSGQKCIVSSFNVATVPWDKEYHLEELQKVMPENFVQEKVRMANMVCDLGLTVEETVVVRACIITYPDRVQLKDRQKVVEVNGCMMSCLNYLLKKRREPYDLSQLLFVLAELRKMSEWEQKFFQGVFEVWPVSESHKLAKEFVTY